MLTIPRADIFMGREKRATGRDEVPEIASSLDWLEWLYGDSQIRLRERIIVYAAGPRITLTADDVPDQRLSRVTRAGSGRRSG